MFFLEFMRKIRLSFINRVSLPESNRFDGKKSRCVNEIICRSSCLGSSTCSYCSKRNTNKSRKLISFSPADGSEQEAFRKEHVPIVDASVRCVFTSKWERNRRENDEDMLTLNKFEVIFKIVGTTHWFHWMFFSPEAPRNHFIFRPMAVECSSDFIIANEFSHKLYQYCGDSFKRITETEICLLDFN